MTAHHKDRAPPSGPDSPQHQWKLNLLPSSTTCPLNSVSDLQPVVHMFPVFLPLFSQSFIHASPPRTDAYLLSAVMLAALLQLAPGAPVVDAPTDTLAGDTSGEEGETRSDLLSTSPVLTKVLATTQRHKEEVSAL